MRWVLVSSLLALVVSCSSEECVEGRVVSCPCPGSDTPGTQVCRARVFEACVCGIGADGGGDAGADVGADADAGADAGADADAGPSAGDPCTPATLSPDEPPTPGRCVEEGALVCDPATARMTLEPCLFDDVCVEGIVTQLGHSPRPGVSIPEVEYVWAQCVVDATPACTYVSAGSYWEPDGELALSCQSPTRAAQCEPLGHSRLGDSALPYNAGSADGYLVATECEGDDRCMEGQCVADIPCDVGDEFCSGDVVFNCTPLGAVRVAPLESGSTCVETTACTLEGRRTAGYVGPDEMSSARCQRDTFVPACDPSGAERECRYVCYGADRCECNLTLLPCGDGLRCAQVDVGDTLCAPDVECVSTDGFCDSGRAIDCSHPIPSAAYCSLYGNSCEVVAGRAVCASEGACPSTPTCNGNTIELCCPAEGVYSDSSGVDLPCTPGSPIHFACPGESRCVDGSCLL